MVTVQPLFSQHQEHQEHTREHTGLWEMFGFTVGLTGLASILKLSSRLWQNWMKFFKNS